jgi:hypothetical protein
MFGVLGTTVAFVKALPALTREALHYEEVSRRYADRHEVMLDVLAREVASAHSEPLQVAVQRTATRTFEDLSVLAACWPSY